MEITATAHTLADPFILSLQGSHIRSMFPVPAGSALPAAIGFEQLHKYLQHFVPTVPQWPRSHRPAADQPGVPGSPGSLYG